MRKCQRMQEISSKLILTQQRDDPGDHACTNDTGFIFQFGGYDFVSLLTRLSEYFRTELRMGNMRNPSVSATCPPITTSSG